MAAKRHVHRYHRVDIGRDKPVWVMKCIKDGCTSYTFMRTKLSAPILRGQIAECNRCFEPFILDKRAIRMAEPCCKDCIKTTKKTIEKVKSAETFFEDLLKDIG